MSGRLAVIDIGSNSVRLAVYEMHPAGCFRAVKDIKEVVRLCENMGPEKTIKPRAVQRAVQALQLFKRSCEASDVQEIITVGTAALRQAVNSEEVLAQLQRQSGFAIRVLPGEEEARLAFLGVINTVSVSNCLIVDIGGGSTEVMLVRDRNLVNQVSLPFGAVTLTETFLGDTAPGWPELLQMHVYVRHALAEIPWLAAGGHHVLVGLGGTFRNLAKMQQRWSAYSLPLIHHFEMPPAAVGLTYDLVKGKTLEERRAIEGLSKDRADIIVAGLSVIQQITDISGVDRVITSGYGLREGIAFQYLAHNGGDPVVTDVAQYGIRRLNWQYRADESHAGRVSQLALSLFNQLAPLHGLGDGEQRLLKTAALLHNLGVGVNLYSLRRHSFYLIANSGLTGLSHREVLLTAFIASNGDRPRIQEKQSRYLDVLQPGDTGIINKLSTLLCLADKLDRGQCHRVSGVRCMVSQNLVTVNVEAGEDVTPEVGEAQRLAKRFRKHFGKDLIIRQGVI